MRLRKGLIMLLATLLIVLTGCQAVGGVDVGESIKRLATVKSVESKDTFSIKLDLAKDAKLPKEAAAFVDVINNLRIETVTKIQDQENVSVKGTAYVKDQKLDFHVAIDKKQAVIQLEGAKSPIVVPFDQLGGTGYFIGGPTLDPKITNQLQEKYISFFAKHAPNPKTIDVKDVQESVQGQQLNLKRIQLVFGADETFDWTRNLTKSIVADEAGTKAFIKDYITTVAEVLKSADKDDAFGADELLKNSETSANLAYMWLKNDGLKTIDEIEKGWKDVVKASPELATILSKDTNFKLDWFVDSELTTQKVVGELNISLPKNSKDFPINGIQIKSSTEYKNVNKPVSIDKIDTTNAVRAESLKTSGDVLRQFDSNSTIYKWLKNSGLTSKVVYLSLNSDAYEGWETDIPQPIVEKGTTFVPLRYVSTQFDAVVKWDKANKQIRIVDDITGKVIVLKVDSKEAQIDGASKTLKTAPKLVKGNVYIPLTEVAELLDIEVKYEKNDGREGVILERD